MKKLLQTLNKDHFPHLQEGTPDTNQMVSDEKSESSLSDKVDRVDDLELGDSDSLDNVNTNKNTTSDNDSANEELRIEPEDEKGFGNCGFDTSNEKVGIQGEIEEGIEDATGKSMDFDNLFVEIPVAGLPMTSESKEMRLVPNLCTICLCNYDIGTDIVWSSNPSCDHAFHEECIEQWLMNQREGPLCPCCRRDFILDPFDLEDEETEDNKDMNRPPQDIASVNLVASNATFLDRDAEGGNGDGGISVEETEL